MTITPGVMNSKYDPDACVKPGTWMTFSNSCPNSSSQMTGWTSVMAANAGWRPTGGQPGFGHHPAVTNRSPGAATIPPVNVATPLRAARSAGQLVNTALARHARGYPSVEFAEQGYVVVPGFLAPDAAAAAYDDFARFADRTVTSPGV